jgi:hypothetical protein
MCLAKGFTGTKKATVHAVAFVSYCSISSVANWVGRYGRILRGFLKWDSRSGRHSVATFFTPTASMEQLCFRTVGLPIREGSGEDE